MIFTEKSKAISEAFSRVNIMAISLPNFPPFEVHLDGNAGPRWKKWLGRFERLTIGMGISDDTQKRALLLHYGGPEVDEIFDTLQDVGGDKDYKKAVEKLTAHFSPQVNVTYEVYNFRQAKQKDGENLDCFHTRLRSLAKTCDFTNPDKEIKEQIILNCKSNSLRRKALREDLDLAGLMKAGRALELSEIQAKELENHEQTVNAVKFKKRGISTYLKGKQRHQQPRQESRTRYESRNHSNSRKENIKCRNCGGPYPHKDSCPARNKKCTSCGKLNHFARVCRTNPPESAKHVSHEDTAENDEYVYTIGGDKQPTCHVRIDGKQIEMMVDSGASVDLIDERTFRELYQRTVPEASKRRIFSYGSSTPLPVLGTIEAEIFVNASSTWTTLHVIKGASGNLLGFNTATKLGVLKIINQVKPDETSPQSPTNGDLESLFGGIGKVRGKVIKLHIDTNVAPKQQPHRRIPFHVRKDVEMELKRLEELDIIETVTGPTPWVSPIVIVPKSSGEVRICVDMREANKAVKREKHLMPTIDDLVADLNGATVFSKLDLSSGYHQLELAPESRYITTFSTHVGLRRYKRLMFGINAASEIFQNAIEEILTGLPGCKNMSDDIIVYGKTQKKHDENLRGVLERLKQHGVRLNKEKCSFSRSEIKFYGQIFSKNGVKADPAKIKAITDMNKPESIGEVKSLLGMAQYVSRYIPNYATITAPLRLLTKKDKSWQWANEQQRAFDKLKDSLIKNHVMSYFNPRLKSEVIVDASPVGLGGLLVQDGKVISYASRALRDVESRYSQTEREMLGVVWAVEHFHLYLYGSEFTIATDHKPLLGIFNSHKPTSARIDRWKLRLMPYNCQLTYRPGKDAENPADFMSRHPSNIESKESSIAEDYVNYVCNQAVPKAMTLQEIKLESEKDVLLQALIKAIETDNWTHPEVQEYRNVKDELSAYQGIVLRGNRIVVPKVLRGRAVDLAHVGHQGMVKTKRLIREKVWFPGVDKMVKEKVDSCLPCQATTTSKAERLEPLKMTPLPNAPWKELAMDFLGPLPSGEYLMVVIDEYSRFPEVEIVTSTSARSTIPKLDSIFARQGIPDVLKSDNGPPFNGAEFKNFAEHLGFHHRKITPLWPRANGEAERFMKTLGKCVRAATVEHKSWKQELYKFLRQYRATPHSTTEISPCEALNHRKLKTTLPEVTPPVLEKQKNMTDRDAEQKLKMKAYADHKLGVRESKIKLGDTVLIKQPKRNKLSSPFSPVPLVVEEKKGSMVTASNGNKTITRNSSMFKVVPNHIRHAEKITQGQADEDLTAEPWPPEVSEQDKSSSSPSPITPLRRSQRQTRLPAKLKDFVLLVQ